MVIDFVPLFDCSVGGVFEIQTGAMGLAVRNSEIGGVNTTVAQIQAQLDNASWELSQTTVRAPAGGYVTVVALSIGDRALQARSAMSFIVESEITLVGMFSQNGFQTIKEGAAVDIVFDNARSHLSREDCGDSQGRGSRPDRGVGNTRAHQRARGATAFPAVISIPDEMGRDSLRLGMSGSATAFPEKRALSAFSHPSWSGSAPIPLPSAAIKRRNRERQVRVQHPLCAPSTVFTIDYSVFRAEVDTGSREENASKQETRAGSDSIENRTGSGGRRRHRIDGTMGPLGAFADRANGEFDFLEIAGVAWSLVAIHHRHLVVLVAGCLVAQAPSPKRTSGLPQGHSGAEGRSRGQQREPAEHYRSGRPAASLPDKWSNGGQTGSDRAGLISATFAARTPKVSGCILKYFRFAVDRDRRLGHFHAVRAVLPNLVGTKAESPAQCVGSRGRIAMGRGVPDRPAAGD